MIPTRISASVRASPRLETFGAKRDIQHNMADTRATEITLEMMRRELYSAVVSDAWRTNMVAYKTWYVPEWLLFLAIPSSALLLAIEFVLRFLRVQGVVRDTYDITDRASL